MQDMTPAQQARLVDNLVAACVNARRLQRNSYEFLSVSPGFSRHGDYQGFIDHYAASGSLGRDVLRFAEINRYTSLRQGPMADYYQRKADIYALVVERLREGSRANA